jgi:hypothetical protein
MSLSDYSAVQGTTTDLVIELVRDPPSVTVRVILKVPAAGNAWFNVTPVPSWVPLARFQT